MDIWEVLGIECTDDINIIKKAYAQKLKIYHPEEDANGYQRLREAYDKALKNAKYAKSISQKQVSFEDDTVSDEHYVLNSVTIPSSLNSNYYVNSELDGLRNINQQDSTHNITVTFESRLEKFMEHLNDIYMDFSLRISLNAWVEILNHDIMWEMDKKQELFSSMVEFLSSHRFLPKEIWVLLDDALQLQEQLEGHVFLEFYILRNFLLRVFNQRSMTFEFLFNIEYSDREIFIENRVYALDSLQRKDYDSASSYIDDAKAIFNGDPELTCLEGAYLSALDKKDEAIKAFSKVLDVMKHSEEALLGRANIYLRNENLNSAKTDFEALILLRPNDNELAVRLAKIYLKLNNPISARTLFKKINGYEPNQNESIIEKLIDTNKALIKMSELSNYKGTEYFKKELPYIKIELKKLQNYKRLQKKSKSDSFYKDIPKFYLGIAIILLVLFISNYFNKSSFNNNTFDDNLKESNLISQKLNSLNNSNDITNSDSSKKAITIINDFTEIDLDRLSKTGERITIKLLNPQILNYCIFNSLHDNTERLLPIPKSFKINNQNEELLDFNNRLYIGRIGNEALFFYGSIHNLISANGSLPSEDILPLEVNIEGRIIKNDIAEFRSLVMKDISNIEWYESNLDSVNTDYLLKMDD